MADETVPLIRIRRGSVFASIYEREFQGEDGLVRYRSVTLYRMYKDRDGVLKPTSSFREFDIPNAVWVLQEAFDYLGSIESRS